MRVAFWDSRSSDWGVVSSIQSIQTVFSFVGFKGVKLRLFVIRLDWTKGCPNNGKAKTPVICGMFAGVGVGNLRNTTEETILSV